MFSVSNVNQHSVFTIRFHWFFGLFVQTIQNCSTQQLALAAGMWSPLRRPRLHGLAGPSTRIITRFHASGYLDSPRYSCVNYPQRHSGSMTSMHSCMRSFELTTLLTRCLPTSTQPLYDVNALFTRGPTRLVCAFQPYSASAIYPHLYTDCID